MRHPFSWHPSCNGEDRVPKNGANTQKGTEVELWTLHKLPVGFSFVWVKGSSLKCKSVSLLANANILTNTQSAWEKLVFMKLTATILNLCVG